jgi:hypothetical protein
MLYAGEGYNNILLVNESKVVVPWMRGKYRAGI